MTDFTNDTSWGSQDSKLHRTSTNEYKFYFGLILLAAVPICVLLWVHAAIRHLSVPAQGPLRRAWSEAQSITPRIFWG